MDGQRRVSHYGIQSLPNFLIRDNFINDTFICKLNLASFEGNSRGYPGWNLYQNGTIVTLIEQASNGAQWLTSVGLFITPAKACNTFQWKLQFVDDSSPPVVVSGPGNFWQGLMIAPGYTAA